MPSSVYKRPRLVHSEPPPELPDKEIRYHFHINVHDHPIANIPELMSVVFSFLEPNDILSCLRTCKSWHIYGRRSLYTHVEIKPGPYVPRLYRRWNNSPAPEEEEKTKRNPIPAEPVKLYTRTLELHPHSHMSCHTLPFLGDLHVDTIITSNDGPRHQPDQSGNIQSSGMHKCYRCPKNNFSADRLIVLPPPALHTRGHLPVFFVPEAECTQTTVFLRHIPSQTNHSIFHSNRALYKDDQPVANPEFETTFIILPAYWDHGIVLSQAHRPKFVDPLKMPANLHDLLGGLATWIRTHPNHTVNVIGIEDRNPYARPEYWKLNDGREVQWEKVFRDRLEAEMGGWTKKVIRTRMDTVNILTFQEFLQSNNWETTGLSSILVNRWLELLSLRVRIDSARGKKKLPLAKQSGFWYTLGRNEKLRVAAVEARAALRAKTEYPDRDQDDDAEVKKEPSTDNADSDIKMQDADAEGEADTQSVPRTPRRSVRLSGRNIVFMGEKKRKRKRRRDPDSSDDDIDNSDSSLSSLSSDDE